MKLIGWYLKCLFLKAQVQPDLFKRVCLAGWFDMKFSFPVQKPMGPGLSAKAWM
jgi:hypothetical protein